MARRPYFDDGLALFELMVEATGDGREALVPWQAAAQHRGRVEEPPPPDEARAEAAAAAGRGARRATQQTPPPSSSRRWRRARRGLTLPPPRWSDAPLSRERLDPGDC